MNQREREAIRQLLDESRRAMTAIEAILDAKPEFNLKAAAQKKAIKELSKEEIKLNNEASQFIAFFQKTYTQTLKGAKHVVYPLHASKVKGMLEMYGLERMRLLVEVLFLTDEVWIEGTDRGLDVLYAKSAWLDLRLRNHGR